MQALKSMDMNGFIVTGLIHIGANEGQERMDYIASGADPCIYVEPINEVFQKLKNHVSSLPGHHAVQAVCSDRAGDTIEFNIANNGGLSSSILPLGAHAEFHPTIVYTAKQKMVTTTVDKLIDDLHLQSTPNLLIIDVQGAELKVLAGAKKALDYLDGIYLEVSEEALYEGGCTQEEITQHLKPFGFRLRWMSMDANGHGDAFYCRGYDAGDNLPNYNGNMAYGKPAEQSSQSFWSTANDASGAVDGRKNGNFGFHTEIEDRPWWQIDLGSVKALSEVRVFNRINVARDRSKSLLILTSNDADHWTLLHDQRNKIFGGVVGGPLRVYCAGVEARYVRLQLNETNYLHLDEVEVY